MKRLIVAMTCSLFFLCVPASYALEWMPLHEKADAISLKEALEDVQGNPDSMEHLYVLGLVYLNQYDTQSARGVFAHMLQKDPGSVEAQWGIAETLRRDHKNEESKKILQRLIKQDPSYAPAYITLAYIDYITMAFDDSVRSSGKVINMGRKNVDFSNYIRAHGLYAAAKGMIAHYAGPVSKAVNGAAVLRHLNIIQNLAPDSPIVTYGLGSYYMLVPPILGRDFDKARAFLEQSLKDDPLFANVYVRLAQIYQIEGNMEKYEEYLNKALELDSGNELALDIKSGVCNFICFDEKGQ